MKITLTGTPGTGKTTISDKLEEQGYEVIHLTQYFEENNIGEKKAGEREIRIGQMIQSLESEDLPEDVVIEGHLSHHIKSDICIVLRCRPDILERRLSNRDYSDRKIEENIEAEKIDIVLSEAVQNQEKVIEIDTTENNVEETAAEVSESLSKENSDYGSVDWSEYI